MFSRAAAAIVAFAIATSIVHAQEKPDLTMLSQALGGKMPDRVQESAISGLFEVSVGADVLYVSADGKHIVSGDMIELGTGKNLTESTKGIARAASISEQKVEDMILFGPDVAPERTVSVFTDIDCAYCRKLHREMQTYIDKGIQIRYLAFPRAGVGSSSYDKAVTAWCSEDRNAAMTALKADQTVAPVTCENPVAAQYELGQSLGIQGTPTIFMSDGETIPGYVPADRLAAKLDEKLAQAQ